MEHTGATPPGAVVAPDLAEVALAEGPFANRAPKRSTRAVTLATTSSALRSQVFSTRSGRRRAIELIRAALPDHVAQRFEVVAGGPDDLAALGVDRPTEAGLVDVAVRSALATGAGVRVVPVGHQPTGGLGAVLRWP